MAYAIEYSVIIPVYNSVNSLPELAERLERVFKEGLHSSFEIIMIDDGSFNPGTWKTLESLAGCRPEIKIIQLTRNFGKPGALLCGFNECRGEYVIVMDDDLQNNPEDIPVLLEKKEHDIVIGNYREKKHPFTVRVTSDIKGWFEQVITGKPKHIKNSPFKVLKAGIVKEMLSIRTAYPFIPSMIYYVTKDVVSVDLNHSVRKYGKSNFTLGKRFSQFLRLLINNSSLLLQAVAAIGFAMAFFSLFYSIFLILKKVYFGIAVSGWTSLMTVLLITSGLILFSLGVVGEYLIRIINGVEQRPPFIVRRKIN